MKKLVLLLAALLLCQTAFAKATLEDAEEYAEAGWNFLYFGDFDSAEKMFQKSIDIDPSDGDVKLGYGRVLYENKKWDAAYNVISKVKVPKGKEDARSYYLGLIHLQKGEFDAAEAKMKETISFGGQYAPTAEGVLKDLAQLRKRYTLSGFFGAMYDTRVIDEDLLAATDGKDARIALGADLSYRYKKTSWGDVAFRGGFANYFSFDDNHSIADPLKIDLGATFDKVENFNGTDYDFQWAPTFEMLWLDIDNNGDKGLLYIAPSVSARARGPMKDMHQETYYGEAKWIKNQEDSLSNTSSNISALHLEAGWKHTHYKDKAGKRYWQTDLYGEAHMARGDDIQYSRIGGSYFYGMPYFGFDTGLLGETRFSLYPDATGGKKRGDWYLGAAALARRSLKEWMKNPSWLDKDWLHVEFRLGYTLNISTLDSRDYSRLIAGATLQGFWRF